VWGNRALDLDDVELVQMLLKEERTTLNCTYGLHYAAMYCDPKIMVDLLKLEIAGDLGDMWLAHLSRYWFCHCTFFPGSLLFKQNSLHLLCGFGFDADTNMRNERGFTVLHVAALRREPQMIGALLARGANLQDVTPDGRTALQICRRLGKKTEAQDVDDEYQKDHLCIGILEQAEQAERNTWTFSKPTADVFSVPLWQEKELQESLSYLENRGKLVEKPSVAYPIPLPYKSWSTHFSSQFANLNVPNSVQDSVHADCANMKFLANVIA
jgi:regulatory protein NPR1